MSVIPDPSKMMTSDFYLIQRNRACNQLPKLSPIGFRMF